MAMHDQHRFQKILAPLRIHRTTLRNRMVKLAASMGVAKDDGQISDLYLCFYETVAKGGMGLIIVEHGFVDFPRGMTGAGRIGNSERPAPAGPHGTGHGDPRGGVPCFIQLGTCRPVAVEEASRSAGRRLAPWPIAKIPSPTYPRPRELTKSRKSRSSWRNSSRPPSGPRRRASTAWRCTGRTIT